MEEYKKDLGDDYIPFINVIDINNNEQRPWPQPEQQQQTTLPPENVRATADIMADILLKKQQWLQQPRHFGREKAHKQKLFALVRVRLTPGQPAG